MSGALAVSRPLPSPEIIESVVIRGDLSVLKPAEKANYYAKVCQSVGLNPLTRPFEYIKLNGKEVLYARKDCTDQLRKIYNISIRIVAREQVGDVYIVTVQASFPDGRCDESTGAVAVKGLSGESLANAYMKCETKGKRRVTLSLCGLGFLDETEVESIPGAQRVDVPVAPVAQFTEPKRKSEPKAKQEPEVIEAELMEREADTLNHVGRSIIGDISIREGEKNGKPWTLWGFQLEDGQAYRTFSETVAKQISEAKREGFTVGEVIESGTEQKRHVTAVEVIR